MSAIDTLIEGRIRDVPNLSSQVTGTLYTKQLVQVQEAEEPIELQHSFYTRSADGVILRSGLLNGLKLVFHSMFWILILE